MSQDTKRAGRPERYIAPEEVYNIWMLKNIGVSKQKISKRLNISTYLITKVLCGPMPAELSPSATQIASKINADGSVKKLALYGQEIPKASSDEEETTEESETSESE